MFFRIVKWLLILVLVPGIYFFSGDLWFGKKDPGPRPTETRAAPVETALIEQGPMQLRRTFSGTLESG